MPAIPILQTRDLRARFKALDRFLLDHQTLWRPRPFTHRELPWESTYPELASWLRSRTLAEADAAHNHPDQLRAPSPFADIAAESVALSAVGKLPVVEIPPVSSRMAVDVPGRKWQQIEAFASALSFETSPGHWLDWCAGKGHLGRRLAHSGQARAASSAPTGTSTPNTLNRTSWLPALSHAYWLTTPPSPCTRAAISTCG
jgi:hypothetical protein